jgi:preprotein translocase subunit SecG
LYAFLLVLLILDSAVLIAAILLQAGKGGGVAASFGGVSSSSDAFIGTRQAGNLLTKASWWAGGIFLGLSFVLQVMSTRTRGPSSILDKTFAHPPAQSAAPAQNTPALPLQSVPVTPAPATPAPATPAPAAPAPQH